MSNFLAITISFSESIYNVNENDGQVELMLVLSYPSSSDITIRIDTIDREATGETLTYLVLHDSVMSKAHTCICPHTINHSTSIKFTLVCSIVMDQDYFSGPYSIVFPARITESMFNISIIDNDVLEESERFEVIITSSSRNSNVTSGEIGNAVVIIQDNDGEFCVYK